MTQYLDCYTRVSTAEQKSRRAERELKFYFASVSVQIFNIATRKVVIYALYFHNK